MNDTQISALDHIHIHKTDKFKTTMITFKFMAPLDIHTMTERSLLSKMLIRATKRWPSDRTFNQHLSTLYGAYVNSYVSKYKDRHVLTLTLEIVNERYLKDAMPLFEKGIELLKEILYHPLIENNAFHSGFLKQEKMLLKKKLTAIEDNKSQIAYLNLLKHMFGNHPYRFMAAGEREHIDYITPESLYHTYRKMLEEDICHIYVVGNVDETEIKHNIAKTFHIRPKAAAFKSISKEVKANHTINDVVEYEDVDQAKLNFGFRFNTALGQANYYAFTVFNTMFGGDPSSVLFNEVREQKSLAYSIHSQIDGKNGFFYVTSGVSIKDVEEAKSTIIAAFDRFKRGEFPDEKLQLAKKIILSHRKEAKDRPKHIIEVLHNQLLLTRVEDDTSFIKKIEDVTREDIQKLCQDSQLDTIYTMTKAGEADAKDVL
ncbi:insulinase family protein [Staphylococcus hyicus]|uniref:EF-P 5-aminopentanol modification-associated protein YfmF n=1 Tax=Staphylococcus hyicus TaxID=1284 RepID=UPI00217EF51E|nr:pitrilysin family protein [Staphylococcus hyicus]UWF55904.1 insulinase family protein [Staphylococcus hyicus]